MCCFLSTISAGVSWYNNWLCGWIKGFGNSCSSTSTSDSTPVACPANTYSSTGKDTDGAGAGCTACPLNTYSSAGATACTDEIDSFTEHKDYDYSPGVDINNRALKIDRKGCAAACLDVPTCVEFTYISSTSSCWLKNNTNGGVAYTGYDSYVLKDGVTHHSSSDVSSYTINAGLDPPGSEIVGVFPTQGADICSSVCNDNSNCKGFALNTTSTSGCWLVGSTAALVPTSNRSFYKKNT